MAELKKDESAEQQDSESLLFKNKYDSGKVPALKFRDLVIAKKFGSTPYDSERVHVEYFSNEKSIKERLRFYLIKNRRSSLRIRSFNFVIKLLTCLLYVIRVFYDDSLDLMGNFKLPDENLPKLSPSCWNRTEHRSRQTAENFRINPCINWDAIVYTQTPLIVYIAQVVLAFISYTQTLMNTYLTYKGNIRQSLTKISFLLDTLTSFTLIMTVWWPPLRFIWCPVFLNCWLAKRQLENIFNDFHRASLKAHDALAQRLMILSITIFCLVFIGSSAIQHFQRGGNMQINLFESIWFIMVTITTVGYGEIYPDIWPSQLFMTIFIMIVFITLPSQIEQLALIYMEKQRRGASYSRHRAENERHVVVCSISLQPNIIMDFLNEFYAHPKLLNFYVVILSPSEMNQTLAMILQVPMWSQRVIYIQGSVLNNQDMARAQMDYAEACFILAVRSYQNRQDADQQTIVRSWAVKDYAPACLQYVHILKPENKMHLQHAKHVVCEDEMKYALLANNCLCPGLSTFMTLILHTSRGKEGTGSNEEWQKIYGKCSGNEIYHIKLSNSKFFKEYQGKSFTFTSFHSHRKFGVALIGIQEENGTIKLNPGPSYIMNLTDTCFYMSLTKEENSSLLIAQAVQDSIPDEDFSMSTQLSRRLSFRRKSFSKTSNTQNIESKPIPIKELSRPDIFEANLKTSIEPALVTSDTCESIKKLELNNYEEDYHQDLPPNPPYVGCSPTICHLLKKSPETCCLEINKKCTHSEKKQVSDYSWRNKIIILAAEEASFSIYNFIVPLRSYSIPKQSLNPILLLLEKEPQGLFLEVIKSFPMVYWMRGSIECLEDLLHAGINEAEYLIIINKEKFDNPGERSIEDSHTIMAVQYIFRMFPKVKICSEIIDSNNMRFMKFKPHDHFSQQISKREKLETMKGSQISYLFRLPFAAGSVFSAAMLDTLLYQSFLNPYLIRIVRLMIGIDQESGSGHLSSRKITPEDSWIRSYGRLYQSLCSSTYDIPIGIYRTDQISNKENHQKDSSNRPSEMLNLTNIEIEKIIKTRMKYLKINQNYQFNEEANEFSYVIINPPYDLSLKIGDVILMIGQDNKKKLEFEV